LLITTADFFVIPVKTGIQDGYGLQNPNWIPAFAGMTDVAAALFVGTVPFFFKESL
jgi:hypothetical protein